MRNPWRGGRCAGGLGGQIRKGDHPGGFRDGEAASGPPASRTRRGGQADVAAWWRERSACGPRSCGRSTGCNGQLARVGVPAAPFAVSHFASSRLRVRPVSGSGLPQSRRGRRVPRRADGDWGFGSWPQWAIDPERRLACADGHPAPLPSSARDSAHSAALRQSGTSSAIRRLCGDPAPLPRSGPSPTSSPSATSKHRGPRARLGGRG